MTSNPQGEEDCLERLGRAIMALPPGMRLVDVAEGIRKLRAMAATYKGALELYADTLCEYGRNSAVCGKLASNECFGCLARRTLSGIDLPDTSSKVEQELIDALDFFDKVRSSSGAEQAAVGDDHHRRLDAATRAMVTLLRKRQPK